MGMKGGLFNSFFTGDYAWWGASSSFTPLNIDPLLWVDAVNGDYTSTVDNNGTRQKGNIIDSAVAETGQTLSVAGTLASKPIYNGEGWFFETGAQMTLGTVTDYHLFHDGSDFEIWYTYYQPPAAAGTLRALIINNGFSNTNRGILLYYDNTGSLNTLKLRIGNGAAAVISRDMNGAITQNANNTIRISKSGNVVTIYVNGVQTGTQTAGLSFASGNPSSALAIMGTSSATSLGYFKDFVVSDRVLTASEVTRMNARTFSTITLTDLNVYLFAGDSNCAGRGLNSAIAADLTGAIPGAYAARFDSNTPTAATWIGPLQTTVNNTLIAENIATQHGLEMRFGKTMGALKDTFILKYGVGSAPLVQTGAVDWNASSASENYTKFTTNAIPQALSDIIHVYRRTPVFRGFIWSHGANDAVVGASGVSWSRSGTTVTVTETNHLYVTGQTIVVTVSSDTGAIPLGVYAITNTGANTYTFTGVNTGATSGTLSHSAGANYKANFVAVFNGTIDYINNTARNHITNGTGYSTAKLRLCILRTRSGAASFDATSYANVISAQTDVGSNYLTDNPSYTTKVLATTSISTESSSLAAGDDIHHDAAGYDANGALAAAYFDDFINE